MLNQQFGQYKIISKLGEGGMANVYLAEKGTLEKKVALKVLKEDFISNRHVRGRFLSEARKMINLNHPNIVGVHDLIDETDFVAIELDYIEGKTLKQHLQEKGALLDDEIEHLFKQMINAIGYVHEKGFIHRDIKPSNFMLTENGVIKLTDFGIAKNVDDSNMDYTGTGTGMQMGTPKYMSPEQVRSTKDVDHRSDIYSLGVVLWEMVTGKVPYDIATESTFDVFTKIVNESLILTNSKWDEVIQKATEKKADRRYAKVGDIVFVEESKTTSPVPKKTINYVIGAVLLLLIIIVVYPYFKGNQHNLVFKEQTDKKENNEVLVNMEKVDSINDEKERLAKEEEEERLEKYNEELADKERLAEEAEESKRLEEIRLAEEKIKNSKGSFKDSRDGKIYKWVKIGSQTWMAENLAYKPSFGNCWAYDNEFSNVSKYGYLYDWETACKVCPDGWHLSSDAEWKELEMELGMSASNANSIGQRGSSEGDALKVSSFKGSNSSGFTALPGGRWNSSGWFQFGGHYGFWWTSTKSGVEAWKRYLLYGRSDILRKTDNKEFGHSVRCVKN